MRRVLAATRRAIRAVTILILNIAALALVLVAAFMIAAPLGYFVAGLSCLAVAWLIDSDDSGGRA